MMEQSQAQLAREMQRDFSSRFAQQSDVLNKLSNIFTPIAEAGPDQQGFGPQELAALNTSSINNVGANYANAKRALQTTLSARGGGNVALPSGGEAQLQATLAAAAAGESSKEQLGITEANYGLGRQKWQEATGGLQSLASGLNPTAFGQGAESGFGQAFGEATKIQEMKNQEEASIAGGITSLATGAVTGGLSFANDSNFLSSLGGGKIFGSGGIFGGG